MNERDLMTRYEVMEYLRISSATLSRLTKSRSFPYIKFEKKILFRKTDIDRFLESKLVK
jgi:excisionase family DNA binding protein